MRHPKGDALMTQRGQLDWFNDPKMIQEWSK